MDEIQVDALSLESMFEYLDDLRESGATNMFGAVPYLMEAFPTIDKHDAKVVLGAWMRTFEKRHPENS